MSRSVRLLLPTTSASPLLAGLVAVLTATATVLALAPAGVASPGPAERQAERVPATARTALTNAQFESKLLALTNARRKQVGCPALKANPALTRAARAHTARMASARSLSHQLPGEAGLAARITKAGYKGWRAAAENIAWGSPSPSGIFALWMRSSGHRANIQRCVYRDAGFGVTVRSGQPWVTLVLARRR